MQKFVRLTGKLLGLAVLVTGSFWFSGCGNEEHTCQECAQIEWRCDNNCATESDPTDCVDGCSRAREPCNEHCTKLD